MSAKNTEKMTYQKHMYEFLTSQLESGETLISPIYGTLVQGKMTYHGYFAFTEKRLLVALLNGAKFEIAWTLHTPLDLHDFSCKKTLMPGQCLIRMRFNEGRGCHILASKKVRGIDCQKENLAAFLSHLETLAPKLD